ncbi:sugar phosphate isomerase/epimerase family protein [Planococcus halocryophilus]|uniref:sugar phosphate isomerase/epimerase family protein n=1 Tax=Planococcus halocryophilus TaxID=1215089 RepID=UPI001F0D47EF|nr:sugar phosphate isomerase/epimerase family protein [Planococcus halocryophilus]MCH4827511.1 sugar phosphate isomerase/epimerase [Planococcus halocryophilus]
MTKIKKEFGLLLNTKHIDIKNGVALAKNLNIDTIQLYAIHEQQNLATLSKNKQAQLKKFFSNSGIKVPSLAINFGSKGLLSASKDILITQFEQILELGLTLDSTIISAHIGEIPSKEDSEVYEKMLSICDEIGSISYSSQRIFAIETGSEKANVLDTFLRKINSKGLGVNFDPSNIISGTNENPLQSLTVLKEHVVQTHIKDCKKIHSEQSVFYKEVAAGKGEVDFKSLFSSLDQSNYKGLHIIENSNYFDSENGIKQSFDFIKNLL